MNIDKTLFPLVEFDLVFSFAGEDRAIVEEIYFELKGKGYKVFYDNAFQSQLVGRDLYTGLRDLYQNKGRYVVCFVSKSYSEKVWTTLEFTAIKERLMSTFFASDFLIPILIGQPELLSDIPSFIGFYQHKTVDATVEMLTTKVESAMAEDNFFQNIDNCMSYICNSVYLQLDKSNVHIYKCSEHELEICGRGSRSFLRFIPDDVGYSSCFLICKESEPYDVSVKHSFPVFVVTWKRAARLQFNMHNFDGDPAATLENKSLSEVVNHICLYVRKLAGE